MTEDEAVNYMLGLLTDAWSSTGYPISYPDKKFSPPDGPYLQVIYQHYTGGQSGFGDSKKKYTRSGTLFCRVLAPAGDGLSTASSLARVISTALEDSRGGVWFRRVRREEEDRDGNHSVVSVKADFEYDEVR